MSTQSNYELLIYKLDAFIRKFYINQLLRGSLYFTGLVIASFLVVNLLEGSFYFDKSTRKLMFYGFIGLSTIMMYRWVLAPLMKYFNLGQTITHEQAANIIGDHFSDVKDKLLNVLQLKKMAGESDAQQQLILASINQKSDSIKLVPFQSAIDLNNNRKYLKYALPPLFCLLAVFFMSPSLIKNSTFRLINNDREFEKEAPFKFVVENERLNAVQFSDFDLQVKVEGNALPSEVFVEIADFNYKLIPDENGVYHYTFRNVQKNTEFVINAASVRSNPLELKIIEKPNVINFSVDLNYPSYLQRENERQTNTGDLVIPEGTVVSWSFDTKATEAIDMEFAGNGVRKPTNRTSENTFGYKIKVVNPTNYKVYLSNELLPNADSLLYNISVNKDQYPSISVDQIQDSTQASTVLFVGNVSDDYGISNLTFNYTITGEDGKSKPNVVSKVALPQANDAGFQHVFRLEDIGLKPGDNVSYYFMVYDNDGVNGAKSSKSQVLNYRKPSLEELAKKEQENEEEIKDNLQDALNKYDKMEEKFKKMREKLLQKKQLEWQDRKELEKLLEEQKQLQEKMNKSNETLLENMKMQNELQNMDEESKEKQEKLEEMMKEAQSEEDKELMEKIKELMQELDKDDALKMMDQFQMQNENNEKKTERLLDLYKQLEMEKDVKEQIEKLNQLGEKQEKLAEKTEKQPENKSDAGLMEEQKAIKKELEDLKKEMQKLEEKNKDLNPPKDLGDKNEEKMDDAKKDMDKAEKEMKNGENKKASKEQKAAAQKMKKQAEEMSEAMEGGEQEQQSEDIKTIRQILENLVTLSLDQEKLFEDFAKTPSTTPKFRDHVKTQFRIKDDFKIIEDSLIALSNRNDQISSFVNEKVTDVKFNLKNSIELLEDRQIPQSTDKQRRTMTNLNDLALMLSESMENMQKKQAGGMPGSQMCQKPGNKGQKAGKMPMDKISEGQEGVGNGLQGIQEKMNNQGKEKPSAKEFAEAAAKQAALRKALQDMKKEKQEQGKGGNEYNDIIEMMDKMETDLVNKRLNSETLKRQKDILTRLLEAEKAERQRGEDEKRKSETANDMRQELPPALQEYLRKRNAEISSYKTVSPSLKPYYRQLVDEYYKALKAK
jgi:hypothetical protein